jgi:UDPglucose 6-dehydrogenase
MLKIGIFGLGFVGKSMLDSFKLKGYTVYGYDKFNDSDSLKDCLDTELVFLALPTKYDEKTSQYDKSCLEEVSKQLVLNKFEGLVVIKSTVEPMTTQLLSQTYNLKFVHNPEFLSAATALQDFHNQKHIVLGHGSNVSIEELYPLRDFYQDGYPEAEISLCSSTESESMKIFVNCFYSVKIQFFNELYLLCQSMNCDYETVKDLMLKNKWINPMHTTVPGIDGKLSYGGYCFPKDTNALLQHMKKMKTPYQVLESTIQERNIMRTDNSNIIEEKSTSDILKEI